MSETINEVMIFLKDTIKDKNKGSQERFYALFVM